MSDMTQSFIEMVDAFKAKPELEAKIATLTEDVEFFERNLRIEEEITKSLRETIARLEAEMTEVTKERDDASFRNLELDEKLNGIEKLLGMAERVEQARQEEHKATIDAMMPKPLAAVVTEQGSTIVEPPYPGPIDPVVVGSQSQSVVSLNSTNQPESDTMLSKDGPETQTQSEPKINPYSGFHVHYPNGEYKGWVYTNKPTWVSWAAFVDGGGDPEPWMH